MLTNTTSGITLNTKILLLKTFKEKSKGLIFISTPIVAFFNTRLGIHTFFIKFPLDIVILGKKNDVIKIKEDLSPNRIFLWNPRYNRVLELPAGSIKKLKLNLGDILKLKL